MLKRLAFFLICSWSLSVAAQERADKYTTNFVKVWGFLKYYHPAVATGKINPDDLFLSRINKVKNAKTDNDYKTLLEEIYQELGEVQEIPPVKDTVKLFAKNDKTGWISKDKLLPASLKKTLQRLRKQGYTDSVHRYLPALFHSNDIPAERRYDSIRYPNVDFQLLALARYWNAVEYLFPYKYMARDWNAVLAKELPFFSKPMSAVDFELHLLQLNTAIEDTHGGSVQIKNGPMVYGQFYPPFTFKFVDGKAIVITDYVDSASCAKQDIRKGDVITAINGRRIEEVIADHQHFVSASNAPQLRYLLSSIPLMLPLRSKDSLIQVTTVRKGLLQLTLHKLNENTFASNLQKLYDKQRGDGTTTQNRFVLRLINKDIAQVDGANFSILYNNSADDIDVDSVLALMRTHQKGILLDFRCYATQAAYYNKFIAAMGGKLQKFATLLTRSRRYPGKYYEEDIFSPVKPGTPQLEKYTGKFIVLVNERTLSQSELLTMVMQNIGLETIVVGTQTAGSDGDLIYYPVPGVYTLTFSGNHVSYPDGRLTQKAGIKIDKHVTITAAGLAAGRDEILEAALKLINE